MTEQTIAPSRRAFIAGACALGAAAVIQAATPTKAFAVTSAEKRAEAAAALEKLNLMQEKLDIASADYYTALDEQEEAQNNMDEAQARIEEVNAQISELQGQIATRVKSMYRTGSSSFIDILLGATSFQAFSTNWDVLNNMNDSDTQMVEETKDLRAQVEEQKAIYTQQEAIAAEKAREAEQVKEEAEALVEEMQVTYDTLTAEAAELLEQERRAAEEAERRRQEAIRAQAAAAARGSANYDNAKIPTVMGSSVVERAYQHLGLPYSWGATGPGSFDCSGFVSMCLSGQYGVRLGTTYTFMGWTRVSDPQPGDVCTNDHHCGIYVGDGNMVHAPHSGDVVKVSPVHSGMIFVRY